MKNKFPKIFLIAVIGILVFPQVSFAAWWNPFTWKIFNKTPTEKVQETKQPSEIEKLRSEVEELKKKVATPVSSPTKPSAVVSEKSKATAKPVTPVAKPAVTATELKKQNPQEYKTLIDENKTKLIEASNLLSNKNIIARVKPSVVYIETTSGSGSGVIISGDGYVLTNAHVVSGANFATVKLADGGSYSGTVVGRDENTDLALLKISASSLTATFLGDSDLVEQGDPVFTFGYPLGIEGDVAFKDGTLSRRQKINGISYLEISAQILPGNSGGPLVNQAGEVIGINTLAVGALKVSGVLIGETLKFALPINVAKGLIPDLKNGRNVVVPTEPVQPLRQTYQILSRRDVSNLSPILQALDATSYNEFLQTPDLQYLTPQQQNELFTQIHLRHLSEYSEQLDRINQIILPSPPPTKIPFEFDVQATVEPSGVQGRSRIVRFSISKQFYACIWSVSICGVRGCEDYSVSQDGGTVRDSDTIVSGYLNNGSYKYEISCIGRSGDNYDNNMTKRTGSFTVTSP